jgi:hypothetical protein
MMKPNIAIKPYGKTNIIRIPRASPAAIVLPSGEDSSAARHIAQP